MRDAVVCEPLRTPVGGYGGTLKDVTAATLGAAVLKEQCAARGSRAKTSTM